ncbi:MAG: glycosyltransferase family 2 protein [Bacteroidales bacterium]|nr:glycosyltransferase family 2 protein [Bacteroidales bacterium]
MMQIQPKYTFLLPAYKARFLDAAIQSILNQTYQDFQLIVSDDFSPENLWTIVEKYVNDGRLTYRRNQSNMGQKDLVSHWDLLVDMCDSPYFILASDDDVYEPDFLMQIDSCIKKYPNVAIFRGRTSMIDSSETKFRDDIIYPERQDQIEFGKSFLDKNSIICISNCVFKTSRFKELGGFVNFPLAWKSDTASQFRMAADGIVHTTDGPIFLYRASGENISTVTRNARIDRDKLNAVLNACHWLDTVQVDENDEYLKRVFKARLQGESRSYYWTYNFKEFVRLFRSFCSIDCFPSYKSKLSFIGHWCANKIFGWRERAI